MGLVELKNCRYRIFNDYDDHYNELRYNNFKNMVNLFMKLIMI